MRTARSCSIFWEFRKYGNQIEALSGEDTVVDNLSQLLRSKVMRSIKSKDTRPELAVRAIVFSLGYRYRLHKPKLPGRPDLIFSGKKKVIFVHGCFWHVHKHCAISHVPCYPAWRRKLRLNQRRDEKVIKILDNLGWQSLIIWECEIGRANSLHRKISGFLGAKKQAARKGDGHGSKQHPQKKG